MNSRMAWVLAAIEQLQSSGSWTGRIHVHKLLFLCEELLGTRQPFEFRLYLFGPYSFDLDGEIRDAESLSLITKEYLHPGYGPSYDVSSSLGTSQTALLGKDEIADIKKMAEAVSKWDSGDLELVATCLWVERREKVGKEDVASRVRQLKPKYDANRVNKAFELLETLKQASMS